MQTARTVPCLGRIRGTSQQGWRDREDPARAASTVPEPRMPEEGKCGKGKQNIKFTKRCQHGHAIGCLHLHRLPRHLYPSPLQARRGEVCDRPAFRRVRTLRRRTLESSKRQSGREPCHVGRNITNRQWQGAAVVLA